MAEPPIDLDFPCQGRWRFRRSVWALAGALSLIAAGCSVDGPDAQPPTSTQASDQLPATTTPITTTTSPPASAADTTATTEPTVPTTAAPGGLVLMEGDGWVITQAVVDQIAMEVEEHHGLDFSGPVTMTWSDDIAERVGGSIEFISEPEWRLLTLLGIAPADVGREDVNEARSERIRGLCCEFASGRDIVVIEDAGSEAATRVVLAHELAHAVEFAQPGLIGDELFDSAELVPPGLAVYEGAPHWVALEYLASQDQRFRDEASAHLPIFTESQVAQFGPRITSYLATPYEAGPLFVDGVVDALGRDEGLRRVFEEPPTTMFEVLFPSAYLDGFEVEALQLAVLDSSDVVWDGSLGAGVLLLAIADGPRHLEQLDLVDAWRGDHFQLHETPVGVCLRGVIAASSIDDAAALADRLAVAVPRLEVASDGDLIDVAGC